MQIEGKIWRDKKWVPNDLPPRVNKKALKLSGIYTIEVAGHNKIYIGQSVNIQSRWSQHKHVLNKGKCEIKELQACWDVYKEDFEFKILELTNREHAPKGKGLC